LNAEHKNQEGEVCRGKDVGYWHALGSQLSDGMKVHLMGPIRQGLSLAQVMTHQKTHVREVVLKNEHVTRNTFVLSFDVKNLAKTPQGPVSVRMWVLRNPNSVFFYVQHALMDLIHKPKMILCSH
jgi:hypothetical protein